MNYMDAITFGSELLAWHHAGGNCYAGLVYRRLGEAKLFSFGNYSGAKNNSDIAVRGMKYFLKTQGLDIPVLLSDIPLRY